MQRKFTRFGNSLMLILLILILGSLILRAIPTDYVVYTPGPAADVGPMVEAQASGEDKGRFMLTAVYQSYPSLYRYLQLQLDPYAEFHKREEVFAQGETAEQYNNRQQINMLGSQSNAIIAVYEQLGIAYKYQDEGLYVQSVQQDYPAAEVLQPWDRIEAVDGHNVLSFEDLRQYLQTKQAGDVVEVTYIRASARYKADIELRLLPRNDESDEEEEPAVGLGVSLLVMRNVVPEDERYRVTITAENIGGPSAGLMFALEIYNRFVTEDISKGYTIAGTGEISPQGQVGVIGGISHKVIGADRSGADIFFAPADYVDEERGIHIANYSEAVKTAERIGSKMKIVEVANLADALAYLEQLEEQQDQVEQEEAA